MAFEARLEQADQIRTNNAEDPDPGQVGRLRICVSSPTLKGLAHSIQDTKAAMGDIEVEVSEHGALLLLEEQLPGECLPVHMGSLSAGPAGGLQLWESYTDTYQPAIAQIASHSQVGDRLQVVRGRLLGWIGMVIGYVKSNGTPIHFDPHAMMSRLSGAGIAVPGASGGGKTSFLLAMFFWLSESGARCRAIDPKIDFRNFVLYIAFGSQVLHPDFMDEADEGTLGTPGGRFQPINRQFWDDTEIFDLARGARGIRDPWRITRTFTEGYNLALDLIDALFFDNAHRRIVKKGIRALLNARKAALARGEEFTVGFVDVVDYIGTERDELATDLAAARKSNVDTSQIRASLDVVDEVCTRLENGEEQPFLRLLLGKRSDPQIPHAAEEKRRTIYTMSGYKTPDDPNDAQNWSETDRNAAAVMHAVLYDLYSGLDGRLVPNPVTGEPGIRPSDTFVDEGNMFTAQRSSRGFLRKVLRQGRSLYHALFFADQRARGIAKIEEEARADDPAEVNQFGVVAVFGQKSKNEARMGLELLRADGDNVSTAERDIMARGLLQEGLGGRLSAGECAFRDPDSRVANAVIDQIFDVLQRASQTNANLKPTDWAHEVPADPADWTINPEALYRVRTGVAADGEDVDDDFFDDDADDPYAGDLDEFDDEDNQDLEANEYLEDDELVSAAQ